MTRPAPSTALSHLRVLDLTRVRAGPTCCRILADFGADVIKIEAPPIGDPTRAVPPAVGEQSAVFGALNRNKRSIAVDIRSEEGAAVVRRLVAGADVLVEAFRPGVLARRGLGALELCAAHPRLVYCSLTGYGESVAGSEQGGLAALLNGQILPNASHKLGNSVLHRQHTAYKQQISCLDRGYVRTERLRSRW